MPGGGGGQPGLLAFVQNGVAPLDVAGWVEAFSIRSIAQGISWTPSSSAVAAVRERPDGSPGVALARQVIAQAERGQLLRRIEGGGTAGCAHDVRVHAQVGLGRGGPDRGSEIVRNAQGRLAPWPLPRPVDIAIGGAADSGSEGYQEERRLRPGTWSGNQRTRAATPAPQRAAQPSAVGTRCTEDGRAPVGRVPQSSISTALPDIVRGLPKDRTAICSVTTRLRIRNPAADRRALSEGARAGEAHV